MIHSLKETAEIYSEYSYDGHFDTLKEDTIIELRLLADVNLTEKSSIGRCGTALCDYIRIGIENL